MSFSYTITYSKRRTLALGVKRDASVFVRSPKGLSIERIERFVADKRDWIFRTIEKMKHIYQDVPAPFVTGKLLKYLGGDYVLDVSQEKCEGVKISGDKILVGAQNGTIAEDSIRYWYVEGAREVLVERVEKYSEIMGLSYTTLKLSNARSRWGSCTSRKNILLSWRLVQFPLEVIDYVVIHELSHLVEMNHSARFWNLVQRYCPEYKAMRKILKDPKMNILR